MMRRFAPTLVIGTIASVSVLTIVVGAQLQSSRCAQFSLPMDINISLGQTCTSNPPIAQR